MTEHSFTTPSGIIRYFTAGPDRPALPTLVFLPGLTADHRLFEKQIDCFSERFRCLVWDAPGHAASRPFRLDFTLADKAHWLSELLDAQRITAPIIIGQSMGGYVAQALLKYYPGRLRGLVVIDSAPLQRRYYTAAELLLLKHTEPIYRLYPWNTLVRAGARGTAATEYGRTLMQDMMRVYDPDPVYYTRLVAHGYRMLAEAIEADLPYRIDCPALLLCGTQDRAGSTHRYMRAWHHMTGLPLEWIEGAGHNSNTDTPERVNALIERFISQLG